MSRHLAIQNALRIARQRFADGGMADDQISRWRELQGSADAMLHAETEQDQSPTAMSSTSTGPSTAVRRKGYADGGYPTMQIDPATGQPRLVGLDGGSSINGGPGNVFGTTSGNTFGGNTYGETYGPANTGFGLLDNAVNNPGTTAINAGFGLVGGPLGVANTVSGMFGGPTVGGLATGSYGNPTSMSGTSYSKSSDPEDNPDITGETGAGQSISNASYGALADQNQQVSDLMTTIGSNFGEPPDGPAPSAPADPDSAPEGAPEGGPEGGFGGGPEGSGGGPEGGGSGEGGEGGGDGGGGDGGGGDGGGGGGGEKRGGYISMHHMLHRADGGIVNKALETVGGQQADPVAVAKNVAATPPVRQLSPLGLYSQGAEVAANLPQAKGSPQQMKAMLKGVKQEELAGYDDAFAGKKSVTKDEIAQHFRNQMPQVEERVLHSDDGDTKFGTEDLTLPGGKNYREVLLKLNTPQAKVVELEGGGGRWGVQMPDGTISSRYYDKFDAEQALRFDAQKAGVTFTSSHWQDPNVLAHLRMADRTGPNGEKILHIEEIQSDWGQKGRDEGFHDPEKVKKEFQQFNANNRAKLYETLKDLPGTDDAALRRMIDGQDDHQIAVMMQNQDQYKTLQQNRAGVPMGPYVTSTPAWTDLALKRALKEAAEGGYDKLVWTPGAEHAKRYNLSKNIDRIAYDPEEKEFSYVQKGVNGWQTHPENVEPHELAGIIGKETADKLLSQEVAPLSGNHVLEASDLVLGGEGMKGYYDKIVPKRLQELIKKHDPEARVGAHEIPNTGEKPRRGLADVKDIMNWHPAYTNLSRQEQSARWNQMTPPERNRIIKDYENAQSGDIMGHGIEITPKMRESILKGQTAFKRGGSVSPEQAELQHRMQSILRPDSDDPEMVQKYLQARASYDMPTHERGAYSARVLPMAAHNVQTTIGPLGNAVPKQAQALTWNGFHKLGKGGTLFTLGGDRSNLGRLTHINGKELAWPVDLHAGTKYMAEPNPGAVWANAKGAASALRGNIKEAAKRGPVFGAFAPMNPTAVDSSDNMFDVLMSQVPGSGISKKDAKAFDDSLKRGDHMKGKQPSDIQKRENAKEVMKNWPGIANSEKAREFARTMSGAHRAAVVKHMEAAPWQNAGFPSVGITRAAITDPELLDAAGNMMGHHVVELDPDTYNKGNLAFEHSTYGYPTKGKLIGKLPLIERHVATPDWTEGQIMDKSVIKSGEPTILHPYSPNPQGRSSYRNNAELRQAIQPINDRMLESIQETHGTGFADGGEVDEELARGGMTRMHPALNIPGVHIRTAEAGEPFFHGEK